MKCLSNDVTAGIVTADRYDRLELLLSSLLVLPYRFRVVVIDNSKEKKSLDCVEKLLKLNGFTVSILKIAYGASMFELRQDLLNFCQTKYLWMLDDDVLLPGNALAPYLDIDNDFGFLQGSKVDLENTESYTDYAIDKDLIEMANGNIPCWFYRYAHHGVVRTCVMDCGNVFIDVKNAKSLGGFKYTGTQPVDNRTGEDILMGARLASVYPCFYVSKSLVFHKPLPKMRFIDKDPIWLWDIIEKESSPEVTRQLFEFYKGKFKW